MRRAVGALVCAVFAGAYSYTSAQSATITAASCNAADVQAALSKAGAGSTVVVPAGTCTWSTKISWNAPANVTLRGAGSESVVGGGDATVIIDDLNRSSYDAGLLEINTNANGTFRLTGMTFRGSGNQSAFTYNGAVRIFGSSQQFRLDHLHFDRITYTHLLTSGQIYGVIDNSVFDITRGTALRFFANNWGGGEHGDGSWADATTLGSNRFVFVEDNVFTAYGDGGVQDSYQGSRFVIRYNTINSAALQTHPTGGSGRARGTRAWEIYRNRTNTSNDQSQYNFFFLSSGTGVVWDNVAATGYRSFITLHSMRKSNGTYTQGASPSGWGYCGTEFDGVGSPWDGNNSASGYPCLDQPGRGVGALLAGEFPNAINTSAGRAAWPQQALEPVYVWGNTWARVYNEPGSVVSNQAMSVLQENRDFYVQTDSFTGASGVGRGPAGARPGSCTTGVAYWATDTETLYKCSSPNTWSAHYQPYTYPHPLRSGAAAAPAPASGPTPPPNVRIVS
jgi:hypothetical protein